MASKAAKASRTTKTPRYLQLAGTLRESIIAGDFADGEQFPTETVLCKQFDVSRFTVREALRRLEAEGLIQRKRGSGTTVQKPQASGGALHQPISNVGDLLQYARGSAAVYYPGGKGPLASEIADEIERPTDGMWTVFNGIRQQGYDEKPIAVTTAFFHERLGDAIDKLDLNASPKTLFSQIEALVGIKACTVTQDIQAVAATAELAKKLQVEPGSPVLQVLRCFIDGDGNIFEIALNYHPGDRFAYAMHIDVDR